MAERGGSGELTRLEVRSQRAPGSRVGSVCYVAQTGTDGAWVGTVSKT
jgi:hypothetical protein